MYQLSMEAGDFITVPQVVFSKLTTSAEDFRFKVALYIVMKKQVDVQDITLALKITKKQAEKALEYWCGAGLIEEVIHQAPSTEQKHIRKILSTSEVAKISCNDPKIGNMLEELQTLYGGLIGSKDINIFVTLYAVDKIEAGLILLAAGYCISRGYKSARYIQKVLFTWRDQGIENCADADAYLCLISKREGNEKEIAEILEISIEFTLAERRRIAEWYEQFEYTKDMIIAAKNVAGDKSDNIGYIHSILKKWFARGIKTPQELEAVNTGHNIRSQTKNTVIVPEEDILMNHSTYIPLSQRKGESV